MHLKSSQYVRQITLLNLYNEKSLHSEKNKNIWLIKLFDYVAKVLYDVFDLVTIVYSLF